MAAPGGSRYLSRSWRSRCGCCVSTAGRGGPSRPLPATQFYYVAMALPGRVRLRRSGLLSSPGASPVGPALARCASSCASAETGPTNPGAMVSVKWRAVGRDDLAQLDRVTGPGPGSGPDRRRRGSGSVVPSITSARVSSPAPRTGSGRRPGATGSSRVRWRAPGRPPRAPTAVAVAAMAGRPIRLAMLIRASIPDR